jgi:hypothetical protein
MSTSKEFEDLQNRKTGLEKESLSLKDLQKNLEERTKILEEKIAIEELKNNNKAASEAISQLESQIEGLERRLKDVSMEPNAPKGESVEVKIAETPQAVEEIVPEAAEVVAEDSEEEFVTVAAPEEPMATEQGPSGDSKRSHDKKKRKFF